MWRWVLVVAACSAPPGPARPDVSTKPPVAARIPHDVVSPHGTRSGPASPMSGAEMTARMPAARTNASISGVVSKRSSSR
jgi:hypothetical protein